jgi:hypothetical protein
MARLTTSIWLANFSAEAGYNYDNLHSDVFSNYDRNRVYIGVTGSY